MKVELILGSDRYVDAGGPDERRAHYHAVIDGRASPVAAFGGAAQRAVVDGTGRTGSRLSPLGRCRPVWWKVSKR